MKRDLVEHDDADALARAAAEFVAERITVAARQRRSFTFAVSGGHTPWAMFEQLVHRGIPWGAVEVFQVDERIAPSGDDSRNLTHLSAVLPRGVPIHAMPVEIVDLVDAATIYAAALPHRFDLVHLGLGPDGHTASLVPGDPVLQVQDREVAVTESYQGHRRMTLTYPPLSRAREVLWLVAGADKQQALTRLLADDPSIPASGVRAEAKTVLADRSAVGTA
jgi:6-phosphogluconolactonase